MRLLPRLRRSPNPTPSERIEPRVALPKRAPIKVSATAVAMSLSRPASETVIPYRFPRYQPGVLPSGKAELAMDEASTQIVANTWDYNNAIHGLWAEGIGFMGYPYLAELSQRAEYRRASEVIAEEMTRKWISIKATGEQDKTEQIKVLNEKFERFRVRDAFRAALEHDGFFGLGLIFLDFGDDDDTELAAKLPLDPVKIGRGRFKGFKIIDPTWTAPNRYDARDPTSPAFYAPQTWFIMGREIHTSRLLKFVSRPLPDILKPAYNFGGLSLSQMMKPYVDNWLRTRQSVADLIQSFTQFVLSTNIEGLLMGAGGEEENKRLEVFANTRSNRGLLVLNNNSDNTETLTNISAPLGTLDHLQAQSQEHICSVIAVPLVKYLGVTPSGLNASADGEIRTFYDGVKAKQEKVCSDNVRTVLQLMQLDEWGRVDPEIDFEWVPLWELDEAGAATVRKTEVDTDAALIEIGAIDADEVRQRVASEPDSPYAGLDLSKPAPGPPAPPEGEGEAPPIGGEDDAFATSLIAALRAEGHDGIAVFLEALGGGKPDAAAVHQTILEALRSAERGDDPTAQAIIAALRSIDNTGEIIADALRRSGGGGTDAGSPFPLPTGLFFGR